MAEEEVKKAAARMTCGMCKEEIHDSDDYIISRCSDKECQSDVKCHLDCIEKFLTKQVAITSQSAAAQKRQNKVTHAPHAALKSQPCPRDGCRGRVQDAERVTQTKRKKELEAILAAPPAIPVPTPKPSGRGRKAHQAPAAAQVAAGFKAHSPSPPPPVQRQKWPQLNVPVKGEYKQTPSLSQVPARVKKGRNLNRFASLNDDDNDDDDDAGSVISHAQTDDDITGPSIEEIDAAVREGVLPEDYRSEWCKDFFDPKGCPRGVHCPFAHNLQQLRIDAAIIKGTVREDFKLNFCADEHQRGYCGYGIKCQHAHSAEELRILKLMENELLDDEYHIIFCTEFLRDGECRAGIACAAAHSRSELRAEAAVLHTTKPYTYRFQLCESFYRTGQCSKGVLCDDAHGIDEVRLCSAVHYNELQPSYKTQRCLRDKCAAPWKCNYYHSQQDRRRRIARKTAYCPIWQELGSCALMSKCYWAHGTDDLDTKAFSYDFPLVNANRQPGEWDRVGKKPLAVKTGRSKQAAWQGASISAWGAAQHHRGSPSAGHQAGFHPRATGVEQPVAVQLNKMPAQPGNTHRKRKPKHHRGGSGGGHSNPNHYKLCREFADKGHCTAVDCAFAHGKDMLDTRLQQKEGNQLGIAQRQKALNPDAARLSDGALVQLKNHKLAHCVAQLTDMGLELHAAQDAAKLMGGDVENASHWHMDKALRMRPKHNAEVNVSGEAMSVLYSAYEKNWSLQMLEQQIKLKGGNPTALFPEQATAEEVASSSSSTYSPRSEASTWESVGSTPCTPWQEAAAMQRDATGRTVKLDNDGFPDVSSLHLGEQNQEALRYEGLQAAARERQQRQAEQQQQQQVSSSAARTPFADARPQQDDRLLDRDAAAAQSSQSLAAMGVGPSTNGVGPSHALPQPRGTFAAMAPQGSVLPPPPYQATRNPPRNPPPAVNIYGQPIPAEPARAPSGHVVSGGHPSAINFPSHSLRPAGDANGITPQQTARPAQQAARPAQQPFSPQQRVPAAGNWQKEMWEKDVHRHATDYNWIQQQQQSQKQSVAASSGYKNPPQQRQQDYEQMPAITAQHAVPRQMAAAPPTPAATKPSSFAPKEFDVDDFVNDAFC